MPAPQRRSGSGLPALHRNPGRTETGEHEGATEASIYMTQCLYQFILY